MKEVYIITEGEYSSYEIVAAFSTRPKAEEYLKTRDEYYKPKIEVWPLDVVKHGTVMLVCMMADGTTIQTGESHLDELHLTELVDGKGESYPGFNGYTYVSWPNNLDRVLNWWVRTDDKERAIKIVNEKRAQIMALGIWGNDEKTREMVK